MGTPYSITVSLSSRVRHCELWCVLIIDRGRSELSKPFYSVYKSVSIQSYNDFHVHNKIACKLLKHSHTYSLSTEFKCKFQRSWISIEFEHIMLSPAIIHHVCCKCCPHGTVLATVVTGKCHMTFVISKGRCMKLAGTCILYKESWKNSQNFTANFIGSIMVGFFWSFNNLHIHYCQITEAACWFRRLEYEI